MQNLFLKFNLSPESTADEINDALNCADFSQNNKKETVFSALTDHKIRIPQEIIYYYFSNIQEYSNLISHNLQDLTIDYATDIISAMIYRFDFEYEEALQKINNARQTNGFSTPIDNNDLQYGISIVQKAFVHQTGNYLLSISENSKLAICKKLNEKIKDNKLLNGLIHYIVYDGHPNIVISKDPRLSQLYDAPAGKPSDYEPWNTSPYAAYAKNPPKKKHYFAKFLAILTLIGLAVGIILIIVQR